jgi:hypothetical protein
MGILRLFLALSVLDWHYRYSDSIIFPHEYPIDLLRYRIGRVRRGGAVAAPVL